MAAIEQERNSLYNVSGDKRPLMHVYSVLHQI
jgi:hypothetical protein